ncbi:MAG: hypothetical protein LBT01_07740 [Spirochaetaceae bacterium]|jgi:hypothetical protein|nr:hypothetical protein [Spirochaetaceae bacterium]
MTKSKNFGEFMKAVERYAEAYNVLEEMQRNDAFDYVPIGDQKTGVIGEAFIFEYLKRQGRTNLVFGNPAQKLWDMKYSAPNGEILVQVKTASAFAKFKKFSQIHLTPNELYLVSLNKQLIPDNLWKPEGYADAKIKIRNGGKVAIGTKMPKAENDVTSGFTGIKNIFEDFKQQFPELYPNEGNVTENY